MGCKFLNRKFEVRKNMFRGSLLSRKTGADPKILRTLSISQRSRMTTEEASESSLIPYATTKYQRSTILSNLKFNTEYKTMEKVSAIRGAKSCSLRTFYKHYQKAGSKSKYKSRYGQE